MNSNRPVPNPEPVVSVVRSDHGFVFGCRAGKLFVKQLSVRGTGQIERDRDTNSAWCSWLKTPASECAQRCVVQNWTANALFHLHADNNTASRMDSEVCDAASDNVMTARFVRV